MINEKTQLISKVLCSIVFAINHNTATAQVSIDLFTALNEAVSIHPNVIAKVEELSAAESSLFAAKQQRLPSLSVITTKPITDNSNNIYTTRIQQPLFAGGKIEAGIDRSQAQIAEAQANLLSARKEIANKTSIAYMEIMKAKSRLAIAERSIKEHEKLLESMRRRVGSEISAESDLTLTRSRVSQTQTEKAQIALTLQRAEDTLFEILSKRPTSLETPDISLDLPFKDLASAIDAAETFSPDIKRALAQEAIASRDVSIQKSALMPSVFARVDQNSGDLSPGYARTQTYVGLEFSPGAGFSVMSQVEASEKKRLAAIEARRSAEKEVRERVRGLWSELLSYQNQVESIQSYVQTTKEVAESFSRQFTIGRRSWLEVLNAIRESMQAELSYQEALWNSRLIKIRLEIETGKLKIFS